MNWMPIAESDMDKANRYKAHAAKLAEALRLAIAYYDSLAGVSFADEDPDLLNAREKATSALAAYEAAQ